MITQSLGCTRLGQDWDGGALLTAGPPVPAGLNNYTEEAERGCTELWPELVRVILKQSEGDLLTNYSPVPATGPGRLAQLTCILSVKTNLFFLSSVLHVHR